LPQARLPQIGCDAPPSISDHSTSNCAIRSPCISFEGMYPFAMSSHLVIKLQMLFRADMLNFFGQEYEMPGPPMFGFKMTVMYFPSHSAIVSLLFPRTLAIVWASSSACSDVIVLFTCVNLLMAACQGIKVNTVSPPADSNCAPDKVSTTCRFSITDRTIGFSMLCGRIAFLFSVPLSKIGLLLKKKALHSECSGDEATTSKLSIFFFFALSRFIACML
jgi:hypothetical protein